MRPILVLLVFAMPVLAADPPSEPRKYLDWWYKQFEGKEDGEANPRDLGAWDKQFKQLESKKPEEREAAVKFLLDVAKLSVADDAAGKAPSIPSYKLPDVYPRLPRSCTLALMWRAKTLHDCVPPGDRHPDLFFPLVAWYLESDTDGGLQGEAAELLDTFTTADADKLRLKLAAGTHPNAVVVAEAVKQLPKHKQKLPADELLALCHHHRKQVREAARELNKAQGRKDPGPFDPVKAMQSPPVKATLTELQQWTPDVLPAKNAELIEVTVRYIDDKKREQKKETYLGWLIEKKGDTVKLLLPGGGTDEFTHGEKGSLHVFATSDTPVTREVSTAPANFKTLVDALAAERKAVAEEAEKHRFDSPGLSRAEVLAGVWLMQAGHTADAATVLLPALDAHDSDQYLLEFTRQEIGTIVGYRMLLAFGESREYAEALKIARRIDTVYRNTEYHPQARRLLTELPKRADDFKTLTLPTAEEWKKLKSKLSHDEQIDYLASRLRLIRMTTGFEGAFFPYQAQHADAERKKPLINPYSELVGNENEWFWPECPKADGLKLTLKDVPALAKHLKDDWLTLCAGHNREAYSRTNRGLLTHAINDLADHDLCAIRYDGEERWDRLTPKEIDAEIERITKWAKAHETLSEIDLQWALYQQEMKGKGAEGFVWVKDRMKKLLSHKALSKERREEVVEALRADS